MSQSERQAKLTVAIAIIEEVKASFSSEKSTCPHCGHVAFKHWNEQQMRDQLNGAITRLSRVIDRDGNTADKEDFNLPADRPQT